VEIRLKNYFYNANQFKFEEKKKFGDIHLLAGLERTSINLFEHDQVIIGVSKAIFEVVNEYKFHGCKTYKIEDILKKIKNRSKK
jgi:hypothetical protein